MKTLTKDMQNAISPNMALELLKDGNKRFVNNLKINRNLLQQANETSDGQHPFAVILSCIDSRTSAELIFDQGLGDVFSVRIAGNVVNEDILGSMEFGCKVAGAKIIVVLGHTKCGAIKGACDNVVLGNLTGLIEKIKPAVNKELATIANRNSNNSNFVEIYSTKEAFAGLKTNGIVVCWGTSNKGGSVPSNNSNFIEILHGTGQFN